MICKPHMRWTSDWSESLESETVKGFWKAREERIAAIGGERRREDKKTMDIDDTNDDMGLSENSVPLHPMVNDHYPY